SHLRKRQRGKCVCCARSHFCKGSRLLFSGLEVARIRRVHRDIEPVQRALGQNGRHLPHFFKRLVHVSQLSPAKREIVVRSSVGRELFEERAVFLSTFLRVAQDKEVKTSRTIFLALRHPVHVTEGKLDKFLRILLPAQVSSGGGHAGICQAKVLVEVHC